MAKGSSKGKRAGKVHGLMVEFDDGTRLTYMKAGKYITRLPGYGSGAPVETGGKNIDEIAQAARKTGAKVTAFNKKQVEEMERKHIQEVRDKPDYSLGLGVPWDNREGRKRARLNRLQDRAVKRSRR